MDVLGTRKHHHDRTKTGKNDTTRHDTQHNIKAFADLNQSRDGAGDNPFKTNAVQKNVTMARHARDIPSETNGPYRRTSRWLDKQITSTENGGGRRTNHKTVNRNDKKMWRKKSTPPRRDVGISTIDCNAGSRKSLCLSLPGGLHRGEPAEYSLIRPKQQRTHRKPSSATNNGQTQTFPRPDFPSPHTVDAVPRSHFLGWRYAHTFTKFAWIRLARI